MASGECTDSGGSLAGQLHVLQRGVRVQVREVQVERTGSVCSRCAPLEHSRKHDSLGDGAGGGGEI